MALLPPHHLARRRLISAAEGVAVLVVEAGAGYGKTTLAAAIVEDRRAVEVEVTLHEGVAAESFTARLEAGLRRAGLSYAAAAMADAGYDPTGAVDAAIDALAGESCVIVIDDVQHADRGAAVLIERMARRVVLPLRLIILGRRLPPGCERLRRAEFAGLRSGRLGFTRGGDAGALQDRLRPRRRSRLGIGAAFGYGGLDGGDRAGGVASASHR